MARLSEKYIAGFLDADGYIGIHWKAGKYKPLLMVGFSQRTSHDKVLQLIQKELGGAMRIKTIKDRDYSELVLKGKAATMALYRIKKQLIIKRHYADVCLDLVSQGIPEDLDKAKAYMKEQRRIKSLPLPNYPPRKWLAGYFDGDGSFICVVRYKGAAEFKCSIAASYYDVEGIEIIQKNFGGRINNHRSKDVKMWTLGLPPSKARKFISYFAKHMILKKDQAYHILNCASVGHYRDGRNIKEAMKQLKAQEHRLSDLEASA